MRLEKACAITLRDYRKKAGLSQHALAYAANINHNSVSLYETADRLPSLATLFAICAALHLPPDQFIRDVAMLSPEL
ncbi:MAG: helix-turn-helix domain-containing protein [Puniceicoccales bacterium]